MASSLATLLKARLDCLEDQRDDLLDEIAMIALERPFLDGRRAARELNEANEKLTALCIEISDVNDEWMCAAPAEYPRGEWRFIEFLLEREWRKYRKFPRLENCLVKLYDLLENPHGGSSIAS